MLCFHVIAQAPSEPSHPYTFQGASIGMSLGDFKKLKAGDSVMGDFQEPNSKGKLKNVRRAVPTPICSDTMGGPTAFQFAEPGEVICDVHAGDLYRPDLAVAGFYVDSILFKFFNDKLERIEMQFAGFAYSGIADAFREKYGPPSSESKESQENGFGATWQSEVLTWKKGSEIIFINEGPGNGPGQDNRKPKTALAIIQDPTLTPKATAKSKVNF
jgi:hypothetical protein